MTNLTKKSALHMFRAGASNAAHGDAIARREEWNDFVDMLLRSGNITEKQYFGWSNPF
tara:strand:+ start:304 stop:477 length:174 start_codon:yes stop_codon:yes gene_type:complete